MASEMSHLVLESLGSHVDISLSPALAGITGGRGVPGSISHSCSCSYDDDDLLVRDYLNLAVTLTLDDAVQFAARPLNVDVLSSVQ
ncbi:unnamed protein product [Fusarium graminearum]|uniref:Chromosome 3, complete genome n=2 Tax=Gibberella zeae TaxID=5518 RepID=A0A098E337_GIBZE|nr:unnamed protein product [Fusarium graminearum]CAF3474297.1 unnamed protein product [Fusarium graminearum]CAF3547709.1 unnamed protein product [Fusarium graminearum]CAG1961183.1 unnamed protein product [Fusarium graminearum]CAG1965458.1 unnamed protein product [Fusarium graminearum]